MDKNYFTLYWIDGKRQIISGPTIEQAFSAAGYGAGAVKVVDWYDNGVSETHYYDKNKKEWVKYEQLHIHAQDIKSYSEATLVEMFHRHHSIVVQFESKDELRLDHCLGCFAQIGWVEHLSLVYGEWQKGNYGDDYGAEHEDAHHFMASGGQYFKPTDVVKAINVLMSRVTNEHPYRPVGYSDRLEDIKAANPQFL